MTASPEWVDDVTMAEKEKPLSGNVFHEKDMLGWDSERRELRVI